MVKIFLIACIANYIVLITISLLCLGMSLQKGKPLIIERSPITYLFSIFLFVIWLSMALWAWAVYNV